MANDTPEERRTTLDRFVAWMKSNPDALVALDGPIARRLPYARGTWQVMRRWTRTLRLTPREQRAVEAMIEKYFSRENRDECAKVRAAEYDYDARTNTYPAKTRLRASITRHP